ncbi:hypothetical protein ACUNWD_20520 [Sunxiuqinia sp. A32]|uniref:hypothetical protein n=1 Tax=Sunxiuqinia sp. A32 TaxID=3461496 RepID=UPI0040454A77
MLSNCLFPNHDSYDIFKLVFEAGTLLSIIAAIIVFRWNKKQNYFTVVQFCHSRYRKIVKKQQELEKPKNMISKDELYTDQKMCLRDHFGLVSEETIYIRQGIFPRFIAYSWLAEMTKRVPVYRFGENEKPLNLENLKNGDNWMLANDKLDELNETFNHFEELKELFTVTDKKFATDGGHSNFLLPADRKKLAHILYRKLRPGMWNRFGDIFNTKWVKGNW